ncbi:hypothetical protein Nepgr_018536 [Nepenthes gracilis]|uniref:FAD-binding PCMH-type domain-containing protein n=1 Tax=Nepenthes gracilis TaxID=150966 RepID=A0AAD3XUD0_NEPGR|nr:hypothetical protein Nepgr_018536 [Nepenthes gracilis]
MLRPSGISILSCLLLLSLFAACANSDSTQKNFLECISHNKKSPFPSTSYFTPTNPSFTSVLSSTAQNLRYLMPSVRKPELILRPPSETHVQTAVTCAKRFGIQLRVRSGGHDFEGVSYASEMEEPFVIVDMAKLRTVTIDEDGKTAWVEAGATLGELYYRISEKSNVHGFPAGLCPSVGVGGHITGGGYGSLMRKYGLAVDNVVDARIVDARGKILNRESMGEELFWAISGGGGGSFGIILAWKVRLVPVPATVTVFTVGKTLEQGLTKILYKWQKVAAKINENLFIRVTVQPSGNKTLTGSFNALFLGRVDDLLQIMNRGFPELGLERKDCSEMSWIKSVLYLGGYPAGTDPQVLLQGKPLFKNYFKDKTDFLRNPIPEATIKGIFSRMMEDDGSITYWTPYGGRMSQIPESQTPFPHRKGTLYDILYVATWEDGNVSEAKSMDWVRKLYNYMTPYVPNFPRGAYVNFRDFDLGMNKNGNTSFVQASAWGTKYFNNNFKRLVHIKTIVDPDNFFLHEQSIPRFRLTQEEKKQKKK